MLFSDLLVETEQDRDGHLKVIHEPLNLRDLNGIEAQRGHGKSICEYLNLCFQNHFKINRGIFFLLDS